jgi:uncharacterized protein YfiM (DUF2279 family)
VHPRPTDPRDIELQDLQTNHIANNKSGNSHVMKTPLAATAFAALISIASPLRAADATPPSQDRWTSADKAKHFGVSIALGATSRTLLPSYPWMAVGVAFAPGLIKEFADNRFSRKDLAMDLAGALVGVYVGGCYVTRNQVLCGISF